MLNYSYKLLFYSDSIFGSDLLKLTLGSAARENKDVDFVWLRRTWEYKNRKLFRGVKFYAWNRSDFVISCTGEPSGDDRANYK